MEQMTAAGRRTGTYLDGDALWELWLVSLRPTIMKRRRPFVSSLFVIALAGVQTACSMSKTQADTRVIDCGSISQGPGGAYRVDGPPHPESCFAAAALRCAPTRLTFTDHGVDAGTHYALAVQPRKGGCDVTYIAERYVLPLGTQTPTEYVCRSITRDDAGLHLRACQPNQGLDIPVPSA